ncbi:MAG: hypothetical protein V4714_01875 [Bacteroidota bacterium]
MQYSTNRLTIKADCDALLSIANKQKAELDFKKLSLERNQQGYLERSVQLSSDLQVTQSEITAMETVISGLPAGETKEDMLSRKKKMEYRLFLLEEQNEKYGVIALLEKEMEVSLVEKQLTEVTLFNQTIEAHKATLP